MDLCSTDEEDHVVLWSWEKTTTPDKKKGSPPKAATFQCPICLDNCDATKGKVTTKCNHSFCLDCFMTNVMHSSVCPLCRTEINKDAEQHVRNLPSFTHLQAYDVLYRHWTQYFRRIVNVMDLRIADAAVRNDAMSQVLLDVGVDIALDTARWFRAHY